MRMCAQPPIIAREEALALADRVERGEATAADQPLIAGLIRQHVQLTDLLREKNASIRRLRPALRAPPQPVRRRGSERRQRDGRCHDRCAAPSPARARPHKGLRPHLGSTRQRLSPVARRRRLPDALRRPALPPRRALAALPTERPRGAPQQAREAPASRLAEALPIVRRFEGLEIEFGGADSGWFPANASPPMPERTTLSLRIDQTSEGYFLISESTNPKYTGGDTWHATLEEALSQAEEQFGIAPAQWVLVDEE